MLFGLILEFYLISIIRIPLNQSNVLIISDVSKQKYTKKKKKKKKK